MKETPEYKTQESIYQSISGGPELLAWFGQVPSFHDAEIVSLEIISRGTTTLKVKTWNLTDRVGTDGYYVSEKHAIVTFVMEELVHLQLEGFQPQNVIDGLDLSKTKAHPDHSSFYNEKDSPMDFDLMIQPCYGMDGIIRCKRISVNFVPSKF